MTKQMDFINRVKKYNMYATDKGYSPLIIHNNRAYGFWLLGAYYKNVNSEYYGSYPKGLIDRVNVMFYDLLTYGKVLHLFSGTIKGDCKRVFTVDINPELYPCVVCDAEDVDKHFQEMFFDIVLADPPYDDNWKKYKYVKRPVNKKKVLEAIWKITKPGGYLIWLDTIIPQFNKSMWELKALIGIWISTNHRVRVLSIFQRK